MKTLLFVFFIISISISGQLKIKIIDPWIRPGSAKANTALFFEINNPTLKADTLLAVKTNLSELSELHETYKKSEDVMGMRAVKKVAIPPKTIIKFKPRDLHIMLLGLINDVTIGQSHNVTLVFKYAKEITIKAIVRDMPKM